MRALIASPLGFLIGLSLGAVGGGGSVLAVPALVYAAGQGAKGATTTSLVVVGASALIGAAGHWRAGRVRLVPGLLFGLAGLGGSLLGSHLNTAVDPDVLLLCFSFLMALSAWRMWPRASADRRAPGRRKERRPAELVGTVLLVGSVVGFLTGFFGVGGGFVIVPALVLVLGYEMPTAVGTSLLVISVNAAGALATRLHTTGVDWAVAAPFLVASLLGTLAGGRVSRRVRGDTLTRSFAVLLIVVATAVAVRATLAL